MTLPASGRRFVVCWEVAGMRTEKVREALDSWREAERKLSALPPGEPTWLLAEAETILLRKEYQRLFLELDASFEELTELGGWRAWR